MNNFLLHYKKHSQGLKRPIDHFNLTTIPEKMTATPPVGPMIGQRGININKYIKEVNSYTTPYHTDTPLRIVTAVYANKTYSIKILGPRSKDLKNKIAPFPKKAQIYIIKKLLQSKY